jgi:hypothetical protein
MGRGLKSIVLEKQPAYQVEHLHMEAAESHEGSTLSALHKK